MNIWSWVFVFCRHVRWNTLDHCVSTEVSFRVELQIWMCMLQSCRTFLQLTVQATVKWNRPLWLVSLATTSPLSFLGSIMQQQSAEVEKLSLFRQKIILIVAVVRMYVIDRWLIIRKHFFFCFWHSVLHDQHHLALRVHFHFHIFTSYNEIRQNTCRDLCLCVCVGVSMCLSWIWLISSNADQ